MIVARSCSLSAMADLLAPLLEQSFNTVRERWGDIYREAEAKAGIFAAGKLVVVLVYLHIRTSSSVLLLRFGPLSLQDR